MRNKDFIILYRGKDFLPGGVAQTVIRREAQVHDGQVKEEEARLKAVDSLQMISGLSSEESSVGTFREYQDFQAEHAHGNTENSNTIIELEAEKHRLEKELKDQEWKLSIVCVDVKHLMLSFEVLNILFYLLTVTFSAA